MKDLNKALSDTTILLRIGKILIISNVIELIYSSIVNDPYYLYIIENYSSDSETSDGGDENMAGNNWIKL